MQDNDTVDEPTRKRGSTLLLLISLVCAIEIEAKVIRGMWFKPMLHGDSWDKYALPVFIAFPLLFALFTRINARKWAASGRVTSSGAALIGYYLSVSAFLTYICMDHLARLAF